jgi:hypothetical protein
MSNVWASVASKRAQNDASFVATTMPAQYYAKIPHVNMRLFEKNMKN